MKPIFKLAYYKEEDWQSFLESIDDRESMHETWIEWYKSYVESKKSLNAHGSKVKEVIVDIDELQEYCRA